MIVDALVEISQRWIRGVQSEFVEYDVLQLLAHEHRQLVGSVLLPVRARDRAVRSWRY